MRVPITRHDADGTVVDGTAALDAEVRDGRRVAHLHDFRDLDGKALDLPPQSRFEVSLGQQQTFVAENLDDP